KRHGWYANAMIIVTGDHGEGLGDHGEDTHGIFLYDSTTHVPLIVKPPKRSGGGRAVDAQVRTTDILPTVLEAARVSANVALDGESLATYIESTGVPGRLALSETDYPLDFGWAQLRAVRTTEYKFIEAPRAELYDLRSDSAERHNIYEPWNP